MENNPITNRVFKDRLFCAIFGREENKHFLLDLYNALNNSHHTNIDDLEFTTIENAIYITMKNDVSFLVGSQLNLYEAQSTFNPNMPLRGLMYFSQLYQMILSKHRKDLYGCKLIKIPNPQFIVFYNGQKNLDDLTKLKLSDAFEIKQDSNDFEWTATVININKNHNEALLKKCFSLYHYCSYIEKVKENLNAGMSKQDAVNKALNFAIKQNYLDGFFKQQKMEVLGMSLTEFDQEEYDINRREEAFEAAHYQTAKIALKKNLPLELISELTGLSIEEITSIKESSLA